VLSAFFAINYVYLKKILQTTAKVSIFEARKSDAEKR